MFCAGANLKTFFSNIYRSSLQASAFILKQNLDSLQAIIGEHSELFQRVAVHPSTNFPGRTQEGILIQLLRKKLEPDIETWVEQGRDAAIAAGVEVGTGGLGGGRDMDRDDDEDDDDEDEGYRPEQDDEGVVAGDPLSELWADIREACVARVGDYVMNEDRDRYTAEEREIGVEKVRTGLKRDLDEDSEDEEDEDEEDEDVAMDGTGATGMGSGAAAQANGGKAAPPTEPEYLLWYAATGNWDLPPGIEFESRRDSKAAGKRTGPGR